MISQSAVKTFFHRPVRVSVQLAKSRRTLVGFIEDDGDFDDFESEIKRMIAMSGMVTPQYEPVVMESWE